MEIPLFPLPLVLFPRVLLPLHIFEERYKEMVGEAIRDKSEFGIVLAKEEGILNAGCTVVVDQVLNKTTLNDLLSNEQEMTTWILPLIQFAGEKSLGSSVETRHHTR